MEFSEFKICEGRIWKRSIVSGIIRIKLTEIVRNVNINTLKQNVFTVGQEFSCHNYLFFNFLIVLRPLCYETFFSLALNCFRCKQITILRSCPREKGIKRIKLVREFFQIFGTFPPR